MSDNENIESTEETELPEVVAHTADAAEVDPGVCVGVYVYN